MPKKATRRHRKKPKKKPFFDDLAPHTKQAIAAIFFVVLGLFFVFSSLDYAGLAGRVTHGVLKTLFGIGFILAPLLCFGFVIIFLKPREDNHVSPSKIIGITLAFLAILSLIQLSAEQGGIAGKIVLYPFYGLFGGLVSGLILVALLIVGLFLTFNTNFFSIFKKQKDEDSIEEVDPAIQLPDTGPQEEDDKSEKKKGGAVEEESKKSLKDRIMNKTGMGEFVVSSFRGNYTPPPLSLLKRDKGKPDVGDIKARSNAIKRALKKFNIDVEMDTVTIGPTFTRYALKPAEGVKLEKIVNLQTNLEYVLAASPVRVEAPIPGKSLVGIEVPNEKTQMVGLAPLFSSPEFTDSPKPLLGAFGRTIDGEAKFYDIAKMPHALVAGTTGAGKSVTINNLIISLLYRNSPDQLRFIMVDPKLVELTLYNGIPHLLTPVITDAKRVIRALKWAIVEMDRRLEVLRENGVKEISVYHKKIYGPAKKKFEDKGSPEEERDDLPEPLPYIVVVIDELADLMSAYPKELEACIVRLAQKSRAIGIHLILATQRPEVKVITGLIKANLPTRIALKARSLIDSRTILDEPGAEKLIGKGDMLFLSSNSPKPVRLQSAFVSEEEVKNVVTYLKTNAEQELDTINLDPSAEGNADPNSMYAAHLDDEDDEDELYEDARIAVIEAGKASTSYLQRKLRIGYSRAARLMDILEERGIIGPQDGSKPRKILEGAPPDEDGEVV
jgi:S-DNA-T family DNA segregation ATPase FtsK/SpoIIIE